MALVDLARRVLLASLLALASIAPALAGDTAQFNAIGYSANGNYFAFEQFGIQDGSGFPYADVFIIDLLADSFVGGSPFRARIDDEASEIVDARQAALEMARDALDDDAIWFPPQTLALRGDGALDDDGLAIRYGIPGYGLAEPQGDHTLSLEIFKAPGGRDCQFFEGDPMGFALLRDSGGETLELHRDQRVPVSRNCVVTYKFYGVFNPMHGADDRSAIAVLSVWSHGFEGPDRRFIAVPVGTR